VSPLAARLIGVALSHLSKQEYATGALDFSRKIAPLPPRRPLGESKPHRLSGAPNPAERSHLRICDVDRAHGSLAMSALSNGKNTFEADLIALIPKLRAFGRSLCGSPVEGDDLAQEALAKAWASRASYQPGSNLKAWTFMILRNLFYSDRRRSWRSCQLDQDEAERTLVAVTSPTGRLELDELRRALNMLPAEQREALILVGAAGLTYEEAAEICGCAVGTVKSRVCRARARLAALLDEGVLSWDGQLPDAAMAAIFMQVSACQAARFA
jgi:RNA polymerase sigma-70 factor (ECF subfamily)